MNTRACGLALLLAALGLTGACRMMQAEDESFVYLGDDGRRMNATFHGNGSRVELTLPDGAHVMLPQVPASYGTRFSDGRITFAGNLKEGIVTIDGTVVFRGLSTHLGL